MKVKRTDYPSDEEHDRIREACWAEEQAYIQRGSLYQMREAPVLRAYHQAPMKDRVCISFSGGKTSAYMTWLLMQAFGSNKEVVVTFANTGCEHEKTLEFVDRCADHFGWPVVWLEAVVHEGDGNGTTHRIVNFETASRNGEPFEAVIEKYGLPGPGFLHCTRELKDRPIASFLRSLGWQPRSRSIAVGIRSDELDRISPASKARGFVFPTSDWGTTKQDVLAFWEKQPFTLEIPEHLGNCVWCYKKSDRKLLTLARQAPEVFEFPRRMEALHACSGAGDGERRIFRGRRLTGDILRDAHTLNFEPFVDGKFIDFDENLDLGGSCGDSCEIGADLYADETEEEEPFALQYS